MTYRGRSTPDPEARAFARRLEAESRADHARGRCAGVPHCTTCLRDAQEARGAATR